MKYDEDTLIVKDKIYIPEVHLNMDKVAKNLTHHMFTESDCIKCHVRKLRPSFDCDNCESYRGSVSTYNTVYKNGIEYAGLPLGEKHNIEKDYRLNFKDFKIIDFRVRNEFNYDIDNKIILRDYQKSAERKWWEKKHGLIVAPPRSGKTIIMLDLCLRLGYRTILIANQHEFLQQFLDHVEEYTDLPQIQEDEGVKLYGFTKNIEDFDTMQICVCTYQQFTSSKNGKERFNAMNRNFGTILVDEAHKSAANMFASVVNNSKAKFRLGVTGTDKRKDGRHKILYNILGKPAVDVKIDQLQANILVHVCDYVKSRSAYVGPAGYVYACKFLANHNKRNAEILEWIGKDLAKGHCIIIPVIFKDHVFELVKSINELYGEDTAESFVGGGSKKNKELRESTLDRAKSKQTRVVVGIRSIIQLGLNVPAWSAIYCIIPINNEFNWKQESSRILTPAENKRKPIIRLFVDPGIGLSLSCFVNTYKHSLKFKHTPSAKSKSRAYDMFKLKGSSTRGFEDEGIPADTDDDSIYGDMVPRSKGSSLFKR